MAGDDGNCSGALELKKILLLVQQFHTSRDAIKCGRRRCQLFGRPQTGREFCSRINTPTFLGRNRGWPVMMAIIRAHSNSKKILLPVQGISHVWGRNGWWPEVMTIVRAPSNPKKNLLLLQELHTSRDAIKCGRKRCQWTWT